MVRCKFRLNKKQELSTGTNGRLATLEFYAVTASGSEDNKKFFEATPSGQLVFQTVVAEAADRFEVGKEYYLDIIPANEE